MALCRYETVMCIMGIHAEQGLRVLAINSLGKFLRDTDRNIRYVALATMLQIVQNPDCFEAVAKHREPIIDCLSEPDITLRKRALVLIFALINKQNVQNLVRELLQYLELADIE
jgi:AP-1 complex subunit gamma-1